ncbi:transposase [Actinosynnema sp. NPDC050801]|uniref:transposase n=1 Tax=unclassified Actinosynnema TaxID=2637065 RepID=UPI0033C881B0
MHMLAALDLTSRRNHYRILRRKRHLLEILRARWPDQRLYLVMDNFSPHRHPDVREWAADNDTELVFLPTCSSWLNWIESEFAAPAPLRPGRHDHLSHAEQNAATGSFIRWRNAELSPRPASPPTHPSAPGPITRPRLRDKP